MKKSICTAEQKDLIEKVIQERADKYVCFNEKCELKARAWVLEDRFIVARYIRDEKDKKEYLIDVKEHQRKKCFSIKNLTQMGFTLVETAETKNSRDEISPLEQRVRDLEERIDNMMNERNNE